MCLAAIKEDESSHAEVIGTLDAEPPGSALAQGREGVPAVSRTIPNQIVTAQQCRSEYRILVCCRSAHAKTVTRWAFRDAGFHICAQRGGI